MTGLRPPSATVATLTSSRPLLHLQAVPSWLHFGQSAKVAMPAHLGPRDATNRAPGLTTRSKDTKGLQPAVRAPIFTRFVCQGRFGNWFEKTTTFVKNHILSRVKNTPMIPPILKHPADSSHLYPNFTNTQDRSITVAVWGTTHLSHDSLNPAIRHIGTPASQ